MSRILPLPPDAISQIHSSKHITSLQGVVFALLENSLDAGASKVEITIDFRRGGCVVEDNGVGVPPSEFLENGGLGRIYHTSKRGGSSNSELHGTTGTYLASLAALSLLSITSRHNEHEEHATLTLHHGKIIRRQVPAPLGHELVIASHGTRVAVRDLFGNMPVRVKQRALAGTFDTQDEKAWLELKRGVVALLLAWPKPCAVKLRDGEASNRAVNLSASHPAVSAALTEKSLNQLNGAVTRFDLRDALPLVFQAGLAAPETRQGWVSISTSTLDIAMKGAICLEPAPTKQCQFISIGIHTCSATSGHNELYDVANKVFTNSSFGAVEDTADIGEAEKERRKRDRRYKSDGYTQKQLQGRKGVDRYPMFVLQVKLRGVQPHSITTDSTSDPHLKAIIDVLEATVTQWLAANHFRPQKRRRRKNENQQGPAVASSSPSRLSSTTSSRPATAQTPGIATPSLKRPATLSSATTSKKRKILDLSGRPISREAGAQHSPSSYFNTLSRIKSGKGSFYDELWEARKPATAPSSVRMSTTSVFKLPVLEAGELNGQRPSCSRAGEPVEGALPAPSKEPLRQALAQQSSDDFGSTDDVAMLNAAEAVEGRALLSEDSNPQVMETPELATNDPIIDWVDPVTKHVFQVNARTGVVLPLRPKTAHGTTRPATSPDTPPIRTSAAINTAVTSAGRPLSLSRRTAVTPRRKEAGWLPGFLKDWDNPVFTRQDEERIPVASFDGPGIDIAEARNRHCTDHVKTQYFAEAGTSGTSKLFKAGLKRAKVIRQVDKKFILCKMPPEQARQGRGTLVLVDQHAASERVILEGLFSELCAPIDAALPAAGYISTVGCRSAVTTLFLDRPQRFHISAAESELFAKHANHFAHWGILYDLSHHQGTVTASQVRQSTDEHKLTVRTLPPGIAERCTLFPNLLIELLRSELWSLADASTRPRSAVHVHDKDSEADEHDWLKRIGSCPKAIIDMLNSRACRSATMFNDVLSKQQCEELLAYLSRCAFPFMCAHGRVSMVPLVEIGGSEHDTGGVGVHSALGEHSGTQKGGFLGAFRKWQRADSNVNEGSET